jgi:hypothetical protein
VCFIFPYDTARIGDSQNSTSSVCLEDMSCYGDSFSSILLGDVIWLGLRFIGPLTSDPQQGSPIAVSKSSSGPLLARMALTTLTKYDQAAELIKRLLENT